MCTRGVLIEAWLRPNKALARGFQRGSRQILFPATLRHISEAPMQRRAQVA